MPHLELLLLALMVSGLVLGSWSIGLARAEATHARAVWGRRLFVITLLLLGATGLVAAFARADGLAPLGLLAGFLVVAMLWEGPGAEVSAHSRLDV